ncbi:MAG: hypothetical protein IPP72_16910 [Chitinophagaceae bacterium]|nr:hypothetical protein [Chitinophagaceae bacterium]
MERIYRNFYRNLYMHTGGYISTIPNNQSMLPGDFFQVRNGELLMLGNIFRNGIINAEDVSFGYEIRLNPAAWSFSDGVNKAYAGRSVAQSVVEGSFEFSKQVLAFSGKGSFMFKGSLPEALKILNWNDFQQALIIKLTSALYSFRELYVVTESVTLSDCTLAVAGASKAELEIATESENFGLTDIFGQGSAKTIQSKDIEYYQRIEKRKPLFFKAKKLEVQNERLEIFINELLYMTQGYEAWATDFYNCEFEFDDTYHPQKTQFEKAGVLEMLQANELNPATALQYFKWADTSMDDVEKLFAVYGN